MPPSANKAMRPEVVKAEPAIRLTIEGIDLPPAHDGAARFVAWDDLYAIVTANRLTPPPVTPEPDTDG
jgi:hypothetical protein